jgi:hypothetical protein
MRFPLSRSVVVGRSLLQEGRHALGKVVRRGQLSLEGSLEAELVVELWIQPGVQLTFGGGVRARWAVREPLN